MLFYDDHDHQKSGLAPVRPWKQFFSNFSRPKFDSTFIGDRLSSNVVYFQTNYIVLSFIPMLLFSLLAITRN